MEPRRANFRKQIMHSATRQISFDDSTFRRSAHTYRRDISDSMGDAKRDNSSIEDLGYIGILNSNLPKDFRAKASYDQNIDDTDEIGYSYTGSNGELNMDRNDERREVRSTLSRIVSSLSKPSAITHQVSE